MQPLCGHRGPHGGHGSDHAAQRSRCDRAGEPPRQREVCGVPRGDRGREIQRGGSLQRGARCARAVDRGAAQGCRVRRRSGRRGTCRHRVGSGGDHGSGPGGGVASRHDQQGARGEWARAFSLPTRRCCLACWALGRTPGGPHGPRQDGTDALRHARRRPGARCRAGCRERRLEARGGAVSARHSSHGPVGAWELPLAYGG